MAILGQFVFAKIDKQILDIFKTLTILVAKILPFTIY